MIYDYSGIECMFILENKHKCQTRGGTGIVILQFQMDLKKISIVIVTFHIWPVNQMKAFVRDI